MAIHYIPIKMSKFARVTSELASSPQQSQVIFDFARPFFIRGGDEGELKAVASHFLLVELGKAYDLNDFKDAWDSGCEVEVVTKTRKADLAGVDKARVKTTVKQITLKAELKVMVCNARSALAAKIFGVYRFTFGLPPRPKGEQNVAGKKAAKILDPAWEVHSKEMSSASGLPRRIMRIRLLAWLMPRESHQRLAAAAGERQTADSPAFSCQLPP